MKTSLLFIIPGILFIPTISVAVTISDCSTENVITDNCYGDTGTYDEFYHCSTAGPRETCYKYTVTGIPGSGPLTSYVKISNCITCPSSRKRVQKTIPCGGMTVYDCVCNNGCTDDTNWTQDGNYKRKNLCDLNTCVKTPQYLCANGYYGLSQPSTSKSGCTKCPDNATCDNSHFYCNSGYYKNGTSCSICPTWTNVYTNSNLTTLARGTSSTTGATAVTDCYFPGNFTFYDKTGTFKLTSKCNYSN